MADINQFQRSRDRIIELLHYLTNKKGSDPEIMLHIHSLEIALKTIECKMEEYLLGLNNQTITGSLDMSF